MESINSVVVSPRETKVVRGTKVHRHTRPHEKKNPIPSPSRKSDDGDRLSKSDESNWAEQHAELVAEMSLVKTRVQPYVKSNTKTSVRKNMQEFGVHSVYHSSDFAKYDKEQRSKTDDGTYGRDRRKVQVQVQVRKQDVKIVHKPRNVTPLTASQLRDLKKRETIMNLFADEQEDQDDQEDQGEQDEKHQQDSDDVCTDNSASDTDDDFDPFDAAATMCESIGHVGSENVGILCSTLPIMASEEVVTALQMPIGNTQSPHHPETGKKKRITRADKSSDWRTVGTDTSAKRRADAIIKTQADVANNWRLTKGTIVVTGEESVEQKDDNASGSGWVNVVKQRKQKTSAKHFDAGDGQQTASSRQVENARRANAQNARSSPKKDIVTVRDKENIRGKIATLVKRWLNTGDFDSFLSAIKFDINSKGVNDKMTSLLIEYLVGYHLHEILSDPVVMKTLSALREFDGYPALHHVCWPANYKHPIEGFERTTEDARITAEILFSCGYNHLQKNRDGENAFSSLDEAMKRGTIDPDTYDMFSEMFWNVSPNLFDACCRVVFGRSSNSANNTLRGSISWLFSVDSYRFCMMFVRQILSGTQASHMRKGYSEIIGNAFIVPVRSCLEMGYKTDDKDFGRYAKTHPWKAKARLAEFSSNVATICNYLLDGYAKNSTFINRVVSNVSDDVPDEEVVEKTHYSFIGSIMGEIAKDSDRNEFILKCLKMNLDEIAACCIAHVEHSIANYVPPKQIYDMIVERVPTYTNKRIQSFMLEYVEKFNDRISNLDVSEMNKKSSSGTKKSKTSSGKKVTTSDFLGSLLARAKPVDVNVARAVGEPLQTMQTVQEEVQDDDQKMCIAEIASPSSSDAADSSTSDCKDYCDEDLVDFAETEKLLSHLDDFDQLHKTLCLVNEETFSSVRHQDGYFVSETMNTLYNYIKKTINRLRQQDENLENVYESLVVSACVGAQTNLQTSAFLIVMNLLVSDTAGTSESIDPVKFNRATSNVKQMSDQIKDFLDAPNVKFDTISDVSMCQKKTMIGQKMTTSA